MWSEQSQKLKETLWQATPSALQGWDAVELPGYFLSQTASWAPCVGQLMKVCLLQLRSAGLALRQTGLKWNRLANWLPVLFAHRCRTSWDGSDAKALCIPQKEQHQDKTVVSVLEGGYFKYQYFWHWYCLLCLRVKRII